MKTIFSQLTLDRPLAQSEQIRQYIETLIRSGDLAPGQRLPSTQELAALWHANVCTVHIALTRLTRAGLLTRVNRVGTFVRQRTEKLTCVGIYHSQENWTKGASDVERAVHAALAAHLRRLGVEMRAWIDSRPEAKRGTPWDELVRAAADREIQGLINLTSGWPHMRWQNKLPIPAAHLTSANIPNSVDSDSRQLAELGLRALAKQGCRSVGLICPIPSTVTNPDGSRHASMDFYEHFSDLARDLGLQVRNDWMRVPRANIQISQEQFGYEELRQLWRQPKRPEGLFVRPDTVARGVILGLREQQVRVPAALKLVLHKNEAIDLLCPMPATFLVSSERELARGLIDQVQKQFRGESCQPIRIAFTLSATAHAETQPKQEGASQR